MVFQAEDGGHRTGLCLAGGLHGHGTLRDELQAVFEREGTGHDQGRELTQRVSCGSVGFHAERLGHDYRVKEYGGLRHFGLLELVVRAGEHDVRDTETEDIIGFFEKLLCFGDVVVKVFAHTDRLCTLSGKYVCVLHIFAEFLLARAKIRIYFLTLHRNGSQRAGQGPV